ETLEDNGFEIHRNGRFALPRRSGIAGQNLQENVCDRALERRAAGQDLVQRGPERVDVGAAVETSIPASLFGREVQRRAEDLAAARRAANGRLASQAEIDHERLAASVVAMLDEDVGWLQVAMDEAARMCGMNRERRLLDGFDFLLQRELRCSLAQRLATDEL